MAAMIWDAVAGAFKDAPTPLIYDASAQTYKDSTGLVHDESAQAWEERWGGVTAYVYGAALETITIKQNGVTVGQIGTDANGKSTEQIRLACGTYDLTGSVSGWTETQTVDRNTERFRAMPEGALYWYGNECNWLTGGWEYQYHRDDIAQFEKKANCLYITSNMKNSIPYVSTKKLINLKSFGVLSGISTSNGITNGCYTVLSVETFVRNYNNYYITPDVCHIVNDSNKSEKILQTINFASDKQAYVKIYGNAQNNIKWDMYAYAIWLE